MPCARVKRVTPRGSATALGPTPAQTFTAIVGRGYSAPVFPPYRGRNSCAAVEESNPPVEGENNVPGVRVGVKKAVAQDLL